MKQAKPLKIVFYCQHVLGVGHLFRSLEIIKALHRHEVILVTGGAGLEVTLPAHVRPVRLPELMMDAGFSGLYAAEADKSLDQVKAERQATLLGLFERAVPDLFVVELYPFGRKAFRFELEPVLQALGKGALPPCKVVCSLRDILVEKEDPEPHERRVLGTLNRSFDAVLVHSDPRLIRLDETFPRLDEVQIPIIYTGFVTSKLELQAAPALRKQLGIAPDEALVVASAGGGKVGFDLLQAAIWACRRLIGRRRLRLQVFTGPLMAPDQYAKLKRWQSPFIRVERFTQRFMAYLAAADLSISMAGYNTTLNTVAARVPALLWPFEQNREQRLRCMRLAACCALTILTKDDLQPDHLAACMQRTLEMPRPPAGQIDLDGAAYSARWIERNTALTAP